MSSYIVEDKTIHRIITFLFYNRNKLDIFASSFYKNNNLNTEEDFKKFGKELLNLNIEATEQGYTKPYLNKKEKAKRLKDFKFIDEPVKIEQALKSTECIRYQCSEGNITETKLYKQLTIITNILKDCIIDELPLYKSAEWG